MAFKLRIKASGERLICDILRKHNLADIYPKLVADANFDLARGAGGKLLETGRRREKQYTIRIEGIPGKFWFLLEADRDEADGDFVVLDFGYVKPLPPMNGSATRSAGN